MKFLLNKCILFISLSIVIIQMMSCKKEAALTADYVYPGPIYPIVNGTSPDQQLIYKFYTTYDLFYYDSKSGDSALVGPMGGINSNGMSYTALPLQAGDKERSLSLLQMLDKLYSILPKDFVSSYANKVVFMVKGNPSYNRLYDDWGVYKGYYTDRSAGIVSYIGDADNTKKLDTFKTKQSLCHMLFYSTHYYNRLDGMPGFKDVSKDLYYYQGHNYGNGSNYRLLYDSIAGKNDGFISPFGWYDVNSDIPSYISWILNYPISYRQPDIDQYQKIKKKYTLIINFYKTKFNIDLEAIGTAWR